LGRGDKIEGESEHGLCLHSGCQRIFEQKRTQPSAFLLPTTDYGGTAASSQHELIFLGVKA
jgi:hypothetical protein